MRETKNSCEKLKQDENKKERQKIQRNWDKQNTIDKNKNNWAKLNRTKKNREIE